MALSLVPKVQAQGVIADVSKKNIPIEWNFNGTNILLFGSIEAEVVPDVVIVVSGPETPMRVRQKQRVAGIWVNTNPKGYQEVPGYYSIVSTRPIKDIAKEADLEHVGIGLHALSIRLAQTNGTYKDGVVDNYSKAIIRIMQKEGLYSEQANGVKLIGNKLFSANIKLPANVPVGDFNVNVYLFQNGELVSLSSQSLKIKKQGFERFVYSMAYDYPILYGVIAVIIAIAAGLAATAIFERD